MDVRLTTTGGALRGFEERGVEVFRNLPFAAPPVGRQRWLPPEPPIPWQGERDATGFGPAPLQPTDGLSRTLGLLGPELDASEDCLTLNVHTPAAARRDGRRRPVMVWIHGGAFQTGTAAGPVYDGRALARRGDVVVVTLNYRVGALGFLLLEDGTPNLGLLDQLAALRFVRDEIASFGGDPDCVTVFGESAGAGSLCALLAMPTARGLFHRAIVQSAAPEGVLSREEASARTEILQGKLGLAGPTLDAFREVDGETLLAAQATCAEPGPRRIGMFFAPVVDGEILPAPPRSAAEAGELAPVPLILSTTAQEMQLYHLTPGFRALPDAALVAHVRSRLGADDAHRAEAIVRAYDDVTDPLDRFFAIETDASLWIPATRLASAHAAADRPTWMARFAWPSPMAEGRLGACHALDVPFTLANHELEGVRAFAGEGPEADRVASQMVAAWTRFAERGDPNGPDTPAWPAYAAPRRATLEIAAASRVRDAPDERRRRLWVGEPDGADPG